MKSCRKVPLGKQTMSSAKSALVITNIFPPLPAVGVHRTVALCRRLVARGWRVAVVTARADKGASVDASLLERVPQQVRVLRTAAPNLLQFLSRLIKRRPRSVEPAGPGDSDKPPSASRVRRGRLWQIVDWLSWWLLVPDNLIDWLVPAVWTGVREARRLRPDVIYSTAPAWTSHLVGGTLSLLLGVPWVADFRDPWCGNHWRHIPYAVHARLDEWLERLVMRRADRIICAWDGIRRHLAARYPQRAQDVQTILNGFDPEEIAPVPQVTIDRDKCVLLHAGTFYGPRSPVPLFEGLRRAQAQDPESLSRLLVVLLGLGTYDGRRLEDMVREYGIAGLVQTRPSVPRQEALTMLKGANVALVFGQSGSEALASVPAKVYECVATGKPVLAVGAGPEACGVLRQGGCRLWSVGENDPAGMAAVLAEIVADYDRGMLGDRLDDAQGLIFSRERMTEKIESVLESVVRLRTGRKEA